MNRNYMKKIRELYKKTRVNGDKFHIPQWKDCIFVK